MDFKWTMRQHLGWRADVVEYKDRWPAATGSMCASIDEYAGKWVGAVWLQCDFSQAVELPEFDTLEDCKAYVELIMRLRG